MKSLTITARGEGPLVLPAAYQEYVQALFYTVWQETHPGLHDAGFGPARLRLFTFGPLTGRYRMEEREIRFQGPVRLELRSPVDELVDAVCAVLGERGQIRLKDRQLAIEGLEQKSRLLFPADPMIRMLSPLTVYETLPGGKTRYIAPGESDWEARIAANAREKLAALGLSADAELRLSPAEGTVRKRVTRSKGIYITGYTGRFRLCAQPETVAALYYAGLGSRGSQGLRHV